MRHKSPAQLNKETAEFLVQEFKEYNELTGLTNFKLVHGDTAHWFESKDGQLTVGHTWATTTLLFQGNMEGEGEITQEFAAVAGVGLTQAHGNIRHLAAKANFRAKDEWTSRLTFTWNVETQQTLLNGRPVRLGAAPTNMTITVSEITVRRDMEMVLFRSLPNGSFRIEDVTNPELTIQLNEIIYPYNHPIVHHVHFTDGE